MISFIIILIVCYFCIGAFLEGRQLVAFPFVKNKWLPLLLWPFSFCFSWGCRKLDNSRPENIVLSNLIDAAVDACSINYNDELFEAIKAKDISKLRILYPLIQNIRTDYYQSFETLPRTVRVNSVRKTAWDMVWGEEIPPDWENRI